jgi:transcription-repair coupling factor (superfamily II helicase)
VVFFFRTLNEHMLQRIKETLLTSEPFQQVQESVLHLDAGNELRVEGISGSLMAFVAASVFELRTTQLLLITQDEEQAERLRDDCALLVGEHNVRLAVYGGSHHAELLDVSAPIALVETLHALQEGRPCIVVASVEGAVCRVPPPPQFRTMTIQLTARGEYSFEHFLSRLAELGFVRKDVVEGYGDFAVRGGIVDVFPFVGDHPIRIEFWGDSIESIREFDILSQRSIRHLERAVIVPEISEDGSAVSTLLDYLHPAALVLLDEPVLLQKEAEALAKAGHLVHPWSEVEGRTHRFARVTHHTLTSSGEHAIRFSSLPHPAVGGNMKLLIKQIRDFHAKGFEVVLACDTPEEERRIQELIEEELTVPGNDGNGESASALLEPSSELRYSLFTGAVHSGFVFPAAQLALLTEHEIFGRLKRQGLARRPRFKGITQKELLQLRKGDFVVHADYGIGRFAGLEKIRVRGGEQEVMKILYQDNDALYVNLNYIHRVQKYSSREGHVPQLSKLGSAQWDRLKARAKKRVKDIARDLIALYAKRKLEPGYAFAPDTHWQKEMEASFLYEDTPDQAQATLDVKRDMEQPAPMDRLICGDVGFGKTEVAVRAAFKAVMSGKQVAILVPTTILAQQHYNTFLDRLGRYSVKIEALHRFKSRKEQQAILEGLAGGRVDVIIGTHRLLSRDVHFKDLGLLVIDEEQRFGVAAKEKLRQLRANVDTLTLTATPIPRTLHFSLLGARDLSVINTPPRNRRPIVTEIAQFSLPLIREAILRELKRGGQVYFVHDRVQTIDEVRQMLEEHLPEARFRVAHGQMRGHELEKTMLAFLEKQYDVLVCTKIIESGIDIPSVNTIIVNRADRFGLAELYQLRGRVGRSNEQAYAYLLTPPLSVLPKQTLRRLQALQEFTELGSGLNLALRDLEIRGAGNLLGAEQSGFIMEMGFEMYQRIVEEAVAELKRDEFAELFEHKPERAKPRPAETVVETDVEALIPDFYIESDAERLDIYRRLYSVQREEEIQTLRDELRDRFGEYPEETEHLFLVVQLKLLASQAGFRRVELLGETLTLTLPPADDQSFYDGEASPFQRLMAHVQSRADKAFRLKQQGNQLLLLSHIRSGNAPRERLWTARTLIQSLLVEEGKPLLVTELSRR